MAMLNNQRVQSSIWTSGILTPEGNPRVSQTTPPGRNFSHLFSTCFQPPKEVRYFFLLQNTTPDNFFWAQKTIKTQLFRCSQPKHRTILSDVSPFLPGKAGRCQGHCCHLVQQGAGEQPLVTDGLGSRCLIFDIH